MSVKRKTKLTIFGAGATACVLLAFMNGFLSRPSATAPSKSIIPGVISLAKEYPPASGWGPGRAIARGDTKRAGSRSEEWRPSSRIIDVSGGGRYSPWFGSVESSGSWQIVYRWQRPSPPPQAKYSVTLEMGVECRSAGHTIKTQSVAEPNGGASVRPDTSSTPSMEILTTNRNFDVQHDASSYYLVAQALPVSGIVRQTQHFQPWSGEVIIEIKFTHPSAVTDYIKVPHSLLKASRRGNVRPMTPVPSSAALGTAAMPTPARACCKTAEATCGPSRISGPWASAPGFNSAWRPS